MEWAMHNKSKTLKYFSVCSGIEAVSVAWEPLGFKPVGFSEIEKFPCRVLAHHYPNVKNYGSVLDWRDWNAEKFDVLVGGTPCQDFSIAGKRQLGERANITFEFINMVGELRPQWVVWENVPGVLSMERGRTFAKIIRSLSKFGYGLAWRILDAQNFGVPQRRRRVFLIGHSSGDPRRAGKVLFERKSVSRDFKKSKEKREEIARHFKGCTGKGLQIYPTLQKDIDGNKWGSNQWVFGGHGIICFESGFVRRLTPVEALRLQGFPDNYLIDVPNYNNTLAQQAVGNSMAVPVMRWIGKRIKNNGRCK